MSARNGPADSSSGPLVTDRHPAENPDASKLKGHGTPHPRQSATGRAAVTGVIELDLTRHVNTSGMVCDDARAAIHRSLGTCPAGVTVRLRLGRARWVTPGVLDLIAEMVSGAVEVVGGDDQGVGHVVLGLRERVGDAG